MTKIRELVKTSKCSLTVAIEGADRIGKATQVSLLSARLAKQRGWSKTGRIETPIKDTITYTRIYEMLRDGRAKKYPSTFQGLQIANRLLYQTHLLTKFLTEWDALIFDRWNASSYAYGRAAGLQADELYCELDLVAEPDITIILDGDPFPKDDLDDYEKDLGFQRRVRSYYVEWARNRPRGDRTYIVDASDTREAVRETIWAIIQDFIPTLHDNVIDMQARKKDHTFGRKTPERETNDDRGKDPA